MPIIKDCEEVRGIYRAAAKRRWVIPCFCSENLTTTEAILTAAQEFAQESAAQNTAAQESAAQNTAAQESAAQNTAAQNTAAQESGADKNYKKIPISLAMTVQYNSRSQAKNYTHTRRWDTGLKLFTADAEVLTSKDGPFPNVDVLLHLDHVQHDNDAELLKQDLSGFSSIMYDASTLPFEENIKKTAEFVKKQKNKIVIEGACDEIFDATGGVHNALTTPENAKRYYEETGVDMLVANLGTEHRATEQKLHYYGDIAQKIRDEIGHKMVLHGLSSVSLEQVENLYEDGICKVNIWTMLERDSTIILQKEMKKNEEKISGPKAAISHFTSMYRQDIIFKEMKKAVRRFLNMWYT